LQFLRTTGECIARLSHRQGVRLSVRPSVRLSVRLVICIKTVQDRITKSLPWAAPRTIVLATKFCAHE